MKTHTNTISDMIYSIIDSYNRLSDLINIFSDFVKKINYMCLGSCLKFGIELQTGS